MGIGLSGELFAFGVRVNPRSFRLLLKVLFPVASQTKTAPLLGVGVV